YGDNRDLHSFPTRRSSDLSFNRRFYSKRLPRKCKTTSRKEERRFELATLRFQTGRGILSTSCHLLSGVHTYITPYKHPNTPCSHSRGGVELSNDYGLVFFISVHVHLLHASGEKKEPFSLSLEPLYR